MPTETVIPPEHRSSYSEKIVYLPDSYQANDSGRRVAERTPSRAEAGLPDSGFVFASFNNSYKITPPVFDVWMRLLRATDGSVLWLLQDNETAVANLKREAEARGVEPRRLIFAPRVNVEEHLARQRLADLFLDTLPCTAHTTASDALWVGLPVLTVLGTTFAGRVAASLLNAIGLPELVTSSLAAYEALALSLARDASALSRLKAKLEGNRHTHALFDTARFTRNLEAAFEAIWSRTQRGEPPADLAIAPAESRRLNSTGNLLEEARRLHRDGDSGRAAALCRSVIQADPQNFDAFYLLGFLHGQSHEFDEAQYLFGEASKRNPASADAFFMRGFALQKLARDEEAISAFGQALAVNPHLAEALLNRAASLFRLRRYEEAACDYENLLALEPDFPFARGNLLFSRLHGCDWRGFEEQQAAIEAGLAAGKRVIAPFDAKALSLTPDDELRCAKLWVADQYPTPARLPRGGSQTHRRIRLAYVSADFHAHALATLMVGVFEKHDRDPFRNDRDIPRSRRRQSYADAPQSSL